MYTLSSFKMSYYQPAVVDSLAALFTSDIPQVNKDSVCINIIQFTDNWLLDHEKQGYRVTYTELMKARRYQKKKDAVEGLMKLSQQPAKSE